MKQPVLERPADNNDWKAAQFKQIFFGFQSEQIATTTMAKFSGGHENAISFTNWGHLQKPREVTHDGVVPSVSVGEDK